MNDHIITAFDEDLNDLNASVAQLAGLAEMQFKAVLDIMETKDLQNIDQIIANDIELDTLQAAISDQALQIIALRGPMADDLRRVVAALRVASMLERIGDYTKNIAKRLRVVVSHGHNIELSATIGQMGQLVLSSMNQILDAYMVRNVELAMQIRDRDVEIDEIHTYLFEQLLNTMRANSESVSAGSHFLFIAKNIERVGDYITNIAEQIYFLEHGQYPADERLKADQSSEQAIKD